jgi:MazG family protein
LLHIQIAEESGDFTLADVVYAVSDKLVRRHPHVYADAVADTPEAVVEQWDEIKSRERGDQSALSGIPETLPALARAQALQRRAERAGFAFESIEQVWAALDEELEELRGAQTTEEKRDEAGDALFALVNLVRWLDADAEDALRTTSSSFTRIFQRMESLALETGVDLKEAGLDEKLTLWSRAKQTQ